ncbi:tRNA lysidine(34) synthetase TilS [Marilutibacter aestuarii]|uniref:tRNA(Ile)-lysidine synthase n=1 Tax=Marilutibacter aestuarii TaxID=1706195 RepID=A0A508A3Y8_9GAMM|nr:tRNA lysidine(34) synthetase TilS [Lysobacter aestuarii]TQD43483.1 tRNA lysidine(34) synthetase TilS [Lysobacter aestuarii]
MTGPSPTLPLPPVPGPLPATTPLVVALSGGLDSSVLLHRLAGDRVLRARGLRAIHVDHGLHPDSVAWGRACARACAALGIALEVVTVDARDTRGLGPEGAARKARHAAFERLLRDDEVLVLAHHLDDQAETFLLRALRASGPDGLAAMRPWRRFGRAWLWRPLLGLPRDALRAYAHAHDLAWVEDPGNEDDRFDRNFLRARVLPLLRERWPHASAALARSSELGADAADLLRAGDSRALARVATADPRCLSVAALSALPRARRQRVLRLWMDRLGLPPLPAQGVSRIEHDLIGARPDAGAAFAWHGVRVRRWRDLLHADHERAPLPVDWSVAWDGREPLSLPTGGALELVGAEALPGPCRVHARRGGERIQRAGRGHSHALKQVLQALEVPPWVRTRLPLLSDAAGTLLAAGDLVLAARLDAWLREHDARVLWTDPADAPPPALADAREPRCD